MRNERETCLPLVKWAGGKRQLLPEIRGLVPETFRRYYEPFLGGGAVFFDLLPADAVLNDSNEQLVNLYRRVAEDVSGFRAEADALSDGYNRATDGSARDEVYYSARKRFNELKAGGIETNESAALFLFLNKVAFNGVYRENAKGEFNVPSSHKKRVVLYDPDNLEAVSNALSGVVMKTGDFEKACEGVEADDFVFFDSPYYETFDSYRAGGFSEDDHRRLARLFRNLSERGAKIVLTNSDSDFIRGLYSDFSIRTVDVKRMINRNASGRTGREIVVSNFDPT